MGPYSSRGPSWYDGFAKPDLVAPGHKLVAPAAPGSTLAVKYPLLLVSTTTAPASYMTLTGTSMAAAVASGAAALVIEANRAAFATTRPALTPNAVKMVLEFSAVLMRDENNVAYDKLTQGSGALNVQGALQLAKAIDTAAPMGQSWIAASVSPYSTIDEQSLTWAQNIIWGNNLVWGNSVTVLTGGGS